MGVRIQGNGIRIETLPGDRLIHVVKRTTSDGEPVIRFDKRFRAVRIVYSHEADVSIQSLSFRATAGNHVIIEHQGGEFSFRAHLIRGSTPVGEGDRVKQGERIGALGNSGSSDAPHLHFHLMDGAQLGARSALSLHQHRLCVRAALRTD